MWWMVGIIAVAFAICDLLEEQEDGSHIIRFVKHVIKEKSL
jgi:hypothetical protein